MYICMYADTKPCTDMGVYYSVAQICLDKVGIHFNSTRWKPCITGICLLAEINFTCLVRRHKTQTKHTPNQQNQTGSMQN